MLPLSQSMEISPVTILVHQDSTIRRSISAPYLSLHCNKKILLRWCSISPPTVVMRLHQHRGTDSSKNFVMCRRFLSLRIYLPMRILVDTTSHSVQTRSSSIQRRKWGVSASSSAIRMQQRSEKFWVSVVSISSLDPSSLVLGSGKN